MYVIRQLRRPTSQSDAPYYYYCGDGRWSSHLRDAFSFQNFADANEQRNNKHLKGEIAPCPHGYVVTKKEGDVALYFRGTSVWGMFSPKFEDAVEFPTLFDAAREIRRRRLRKCSIVYFETAPTLS